MYPVNFNFRIAKFRSIYMCVNVLTTMEKLCLTVLVLLFVPCDAPGPHNKDEDCHTIPHDSQRYPAGYLGCFHKDIVDFDEHLKKIPDGNSGSECKRRCKETYRYAGTKKKEECHCANNFKHNQNDAECDKQCTGNADEKCGGKDHLSVYDTWTQINGGYIGCFSDKTVHFPMQLTDNDKNNSVENCKKGCNDANYRYAGTKDGKECHCTNDTNCEAKCNEPCPGNTIEMCGGKDYFSVYDMMMTTSTAQPLTNISETTMIYTEDDDDNGSVVAAAVTVPVVILIAIGVVIALFLWRRRRQKSTPTMESHSGTPITNKNYEHQGEHGLDKRVSFLNIRTNDSVDSEYTEITLENSHPEDTTGSVYQTIDILPEDQIESSSGYGHLKMQKTNFIDKNYSHVSADQTNGKTSTDLTYAHTDSATDGQDSGDNDETMYNRLQTNPKANNGKHLPEKQEEGNDDADTEYNHATAGLPELSSENNIDTYSHLSSSLQNTHAQNSSNLMTRNIENERKEMQPYETFKESDIRPYDLGKVLNGDKGQQKVDSDGYETAVGTVHGYFILEPENGPSDNEVSFHVVEDNTEGKANDSTCAEPYH